MNPSLPHFLSLRKTNIQAASKILNESRGLSTAKSSENGIASVSSRFSLAQTMDRLESAIMSRGMKIFARIDFSGDAEKEGLKMLPTKMLIFGNPRAGTPLMIASPSLAIDLPLKVLVAADESGKVWASYNTPEYLKARRKIPDQLLKNISGVGALVEAAVG